MKIRDFFYFVLAVFISIVCSGLFFWQMTLILNFTSLDDRIAWIIFGNGADSYDTFMALCIFNAIGGFYLTFKFVKNKLGFKFADE